MSETIRVLVVEDSEDDALLVLRTLRRGGYEPDWLRVQTRKEMQSALKEREWDVVLSDYKLPRFDAPSALRVLFDSGLDIPFIVVSGTIGEEVAVDVMKAGAHDYFSKDKLMRLTSAIKREIQEAENRRRRLVAEQEREKLQEQLSQAQKLESIGRLAGGVAHDFNNMLNVILGHTEMLLDDLPRQSIWRASLEEIRKAAQRSADLTRQLLAFARKQTTTPKVIDLNDTIQGMLGMLRKLIGENIELVWQPSRKTGCVRMDPSQLDQILVNLCVNAHDAIDKVGSITITTDHVAFEKEDYSQNFDIVPGDYMLLVVTDTGHGMSKETLAQIFEPFFTTKDVGKGTGLGLSTVFGVVKQNNGYIRVYSEPGQGTTFKLYFPECSTQQDRHDVKEIPTASAPGEETILLVEDEPAILKMTGTLLERLGYNVLSAATPVEAIQLAGEYAKQLKEQKTDNNIHLLITDVVMPEMNGRDLAAKLVDIYPDIKVLFMSGYTSEHISHQGMLENSVDFLQKPFSHKMIANKVREVMKK
ncbi:MAG: response regulator [candidate division KSB1 bacterium]|nr:response regulator [candidate division KSB1 bacterium]